MGPIFNSPLRVFRVRAVIQILEAFTTGAPGTLLPISAVGDGEGWWL